MPSSKLERSCGQSGGWAECSSVGRAPLATAQVPELSAEQEAQETLALWRHCHCCHCAQREVKASPSLQSLSHCPECWSRRFPRTVGGACSRCKGNGSPEGCPWQWENLPGPAQSTEHLRCILSIKENTLFKNSFAFVFAQWGAWGTWGTSRCACRVPPLSRLLLSRAQASVPQLGIQRTGTSAA